MEWTCPNCTFINENDKRRCDVCGAERPMKSLVDMFSLQSMIEWQCIKCNAVNNGNKTKCGKCHSIGTWSFESGVDQYSLLSEAVGFEEECEREHDEFDSSSEIVGNDVEVAEIRIVLFGRTGEGKSATGNTILGMDLFESSMSSVSVTRGCQRGTSTRFARSIQVIDTPGMYDTEMSIPDITREVIKCVAMTAPGPHAFLLVIKPDRFTEEVQNTIDYFQKIFGDGMLNNLIILFTKRDELAYNRKAINDYVEQGSDKLKFLLQSCNNRYVTFNNRGTPDEKEEDVKSLLDAIDEMVQDNRGVYTSEMFQQAEKIMKEKEETLKREHEENLERQRSQIREECNKQLRTAEENYIDITGQMQQRLQVLEQQATGRSRQESADLKRLLNETRMQREKEKRRIRYTADDNVKTLTNQKVNFREKARQEASKGAKFMKEKLLPALLKVGEKALPVLLSIGISILFKLL